MRIRSASLILILAIFSKNIIALDVINHTQISTRSANNSILYDNDEFLRDIGINKDKFKVNLGDGYYLIDDAIGKGAEFEDNTETYLRPLNHFYDPVNDQGLLHRFRPPLSGDLIFKSPDWALEDTINTPLQQYSLRHAKSYFYNALTAETQEAREENFGYLFRSIGQVIHHVQDMAQPQHVRNDAHCDSDALCKNPDEYSLGITGLYEPSLFEKYTKLNSKIVSQYYSGYQTVDFNRAFDYWHTDDGKGMADFTNYNFVTEETNFIYPGIHIQPYLEPGPLPQPYRTAGYDYPMATALSHAYPIEDLLPKLANQGVSGEMYFVTSEITDNLTGVTDTNMNSSTFSVFDQDLTRVPDCVEYTLDDNNQTYTYSTCRVITYNHINVAASYRYLIPRAVAYSTGLINYFFRGRLDVVDASKKLDAGGNPVLSITVKNISGDGNVFSGGNFELFYDADDGTRKKLSLSLGSGPTSVVNDGEHTLITDYPADIDYSKNKPFMIVYHGKIGQEDGVAGLAYGFDRVYIANHQQNREYSKGAIDIYNNIGEYYESRSSGTSEYYTSHLTVYDGDIFNSGVTGFRVPSVFKNGGYLTPLIAGGDGYIASNDEGLYVTTNEHPPDYYTRVSRYDHDGNLIKVINLNEWGAHQLAANNHGFMAAYWDTAKIYDIEGEVIEDISLYVDYIMGVAATKDRFFILNALSSSVELIVFDRSGSVDQIIPLPQAGARLAISNRYLYMTGRDYRTGESYLIVYNRNIVRDNSGEISEERYEYNDTHIIPDAYFDGVSVNFESAENNDH